MPTPEEVLVFDDSKKLLLDSARALEYGNLELVNAHLERVWTLGAELMEDEEYQGRGRMVKYYAESIVRRAYGLQPSTPYFYSLLPCYYHWAPFDKIEPNVLFPCYSDWAPFHKIEPNDLNLKRKKQVHLIDFYLPHLYDGGFNRPYLFDGLSKVCGESETVCVRLSVVLPPFLKNRVDFRKEEEYLARKAEEENIKLKDFKIVYANNLGEVDDAVLPRRVEEDEALVIFYSNKLHRLVQKRQELLIEFLMLAITFPDVVFITEPNANHNHSNFIQRLEDSFPYYIPDRNLGLVEESIWDLGIVGEKIRRGEIGNIVGCEGKDRVERHLTLHQWRSLFLTGFMIPVPLQPKGNYRQEDGCLVYGDHFHSAWKFNPLDPDETFTSLMSLSTHKLFDHSESEDTVQPIPVPKEQHSSMNRMAAFVEIYDMLEDMCVKHEIQLVLTWVCGANRTVSDSYKKLTLFLEPTPSYYIDHESYEFMRRCSKYSLEEGQGIAGKAVQSNEPFLFEPDITQLEQPDYPFASAVREFGPHAVVAICLENNYNNDIYVLEFFIPPSEETPMTPDSLARHIFDNLSNMKKRFVTLRNHVSTKVDFRKEAKISNINQHVTILDEIRNASPFDHNQQWGETSNSKTALNGITLPSEPRVASSSLNGMQQTQGPHDQLETGNYTSLEPIGNNEIEIVKEANYVNELPLSSARKRRLTSNVWDEFNKVPYNDPKDKKAKVWAICSHCEKKFDGSSKKGTTHLRNHLNRCKIRGTKLVIKDSELTLLPGTGSEHQSVGEGNSSFDQDRSRMDAARMFIKLQLPFNMVGHESFSNFVKNLQPMFKVQSQEALSSDILRVYQEEKGTLIEYFDKLSCRLNLTVSLWTHDPEKVTYSCFAVQFVDDKWVLKKKIIAFKSLGHEKEFEPKIFLETLENLFAEWKFDKKLCSLTIRNFASSSLEISEEIRKIWHRFEASYPLSTFCVSFDGCINGLLAMNKSGNQLDNDIMRSSSACLPDIHDIYKKQSQLEIRDYPLMSVRSDNSWRRTCSLVLAIAAILDPRFKFDLVEFSYSTIYGPDSAGNDLAMIRRTLTNIFNEYASNIYSLNDTNALASLSVAEEKTMETFQKWYNSKMKITTETSELDKYLQEPIICLETEQFEVLGWWSAHASKFPILGRMARDILAIPMSTIIQQGSSLNEKVMMDNPIFKGLDPQIIEAMICGKDWLESPQETSSAVEPVLRENNGQPPAHPLDHLSSESDHKEAPSLPKGSSRPTWSEEDVRTYLMYPLTEKESEYLLKWQSHQISGAQDKILDKALAPLLLIPPSDVHLQNPKQYYIDDRVVNQFFILLKRRYDKFPSKYLKHHSFDSAAATKLFQNQSEDWSSWVKPKDLKDTHWVFLPMCLNQHWLLFCADIDSKNLLWLDSFGYAQLAYANEKAVIRKWFKEVVLPAMDQPKPNDTDWPYIIPTEVPLQKNTVDCGLFVMKYADCLTHGNNDFPFTQDDMPHFRHRTFLDLIHGEIHYKQVQKELTGCEMDVDKSLDSIG